MTLAETVKAFSKRKVLVLGDLVADRYILGFTSRVSREAPVLILRYDSEMISPGGGANALHNVHTLGGSPIPVGIVGEDDAGHKLLKILAAKEIDTSGILVVPSWRTVTKTRILAGGHHTVKQQVVRIDKEPQSPLPSQVAKLLKERFMERIGEAEAIIVSDYGYGVLSPKLRSILPSWSDKCPVVVGSRFSVLEYKGVTAATPNEPEAAAALGIPSVENGNVEWVGKRLLELSNNKAILLTRGKKGMALFQGSGEIYHIPIYGTDEVADVTGAGDTVIATFTLALASGGGFLEAARLANYAGGIVVMKSGTGTVSGKELMQAIESEYEKNL